MRVTLRTTRLDPFSALALGILAAGMAGGCSDQPATGPRVVESPGVQNNREESVKDAMPRGANGPQYKQKAARRRESIKTSMPRGADEPEYQHKAAQRRAAAVDLGGAGAFGPPNKK
jgi:hypothetical protein